MSGPGPDRREPLREFLREWVLEKKVPEKIGFSRALGTALLVLLLVQALTGMLLALVYAPTPDHAYDSIRYIDEDVAGGALLRGLHHFGSSAIIVLLVLHMARVFFTGAYKSPRGTLWLVGVLLLTVILGFGFTGYLLPWDQKAYWATSVGINIMAGVPAVGPVLARFVCGGLEIGAPTLTRMYALHVLFLPAALWTLVAVHLFLVHRLGITPPGLRVGEPEVKRAPFFPDHVFREVLIACVALAAVVTLAGWLGPPLEAPAAADAEGYDPRPEWYFLGLFQLLKYFEGDAVWLGTVVLPGALMTAALLLPWLDRGPERCFRRRPLATSLGLLLLLLITTLTVLGAMDPGSRSKPPERVRESEDPYEPPPSPAFTTAQGLPPDPLTDAGLDEEFDAENADGPALVTYYECTNCHTLAGEGDDMGYEGPALEEVGVGRDSAWLHALLIDPTQEHPDTDMPSAADLEMTEVHREKLVNFLLDLARARARGDATPPGSR